MYNIFIGFMIFMVLIIILLHFRVWKKPVARLEMYKYQKKWGFIYTDINFKEKRNFAYLIYFYVRRFIYVLACFMLNSFGSMQILVLFYLNLAALIFIGGFQPYSERFKNRMELLNECFVCTLCLMLIGFTDYVPEQETQFNFGYMFIGVLTIILLLNVY